MAVSPAQQMAEMATAVAKPTVVPVTAVVVKVAAVAAATVVVAAAEMEAAAVGLARMVVEEVPGAQEAADCRLE